jgi:transcriptional regulator with PAS, ATPase and Fis domain
MDDSSLGNGGSMVGRIVPVLAAVVIAGGGVVYAVHAHQGAARLAAQNQQQTADLAAARTQLSDLTAKVNALSAQQAAAAQTAQPSQPAQAATTAPIVHHMAKPSAVRRNDPRFAKLQSQLDQQEQEIQQTKGDLATTSTQLSGSIAHTHDELVVLEKRGERSYFEFDLSKSKQYSHEGPVGVSLRKANVKHQYADLQLMVDDRDLVQKHVNLDQPVMFYMPDTEVPIQIVINQISKDHIHGYVSAPKYRKSELAAMDDANNAAGAQNASATPDTQPAPRKKLTVAQQDAAPQDNPQ